MKKVVKIILWSLVAVAVVGYGVYAATAPLKVEAVVLSPETASLSFTEQGVYAWQETCEVFPLMSGEIVEVRAVKGDTVQPGDALIVIEAADLDYELSQLEHTITGYEAQQAQAREAEQQQRDSLADSRGSLMGQIKSLEAQLKDWEKREESLELQLSHQYEVVTANRRLVRYANDALEDAEDTNDDTIILAAETNAAQARQLLANSLVLLEQLSVSNQPREYYEGQRDSLLAEVSAIDARLGKDYSASPVRFYAAQIEGTRARIEQLRLQQGRAEATAPVGGVLTSVSAKERNIASTQAPIAVIGSDSMLEVFVSMRDLGSVAPSDTVQVKLPRRMGDELLFGTVVSIENEATTRLSPLGVEERKVKALIRVEEGTLLIGEEADVTFTVFRREESIVVPKTAVFEQDGHDMVWIIRDGALERRTVQKGLELREGYLIESGLSAGELVVRDANTEKLAEGARAQAENGN